MGTTRTDGNGIVNHYQIFLIACIGVVAVGVNLPLGYAREGTARLSAKWFLYVHLSIPLVAFLRISNHLSPWAIPAFIGCAVIGQILGGRYRRHRDNRA
jgi:hypothetical protein